MFFISVVIAAWLVFAYLFFRTNRERFSLANALLPLLFFSIIVTIDFHFNFQTATIPMFNDGIGCPGYFAYMIFGYKENWSLPLFVQAYHIALTITCILVALYTAALMIKPRKRKSEQPGLAEHSK